MSRAEICWLMSMVFFIAADAASNPFSGVVFVACSMFWLVRAVLPAFDRYWREE